MEAEDKLFLSGRVSQNGEIEVTVESYICLFVYMYSDFKLSLYLVDEAEEYLCVVPSKVLESVKYQCLKRDDVQFQEMHVFLPAVEANSGNTFIAGICGVLRWSLKDQTSKCPNHYSKSLLGFRGGCLVSCTESSIWTKFCELQIPSSVCEVASIMKSGKSIKSIPENIMLLEAHLQRPVRTHNILKRKLDIAKKVKQSKSTEEGSKTEISSNAEPSLTIYDSNSLPLKTDDLATTLENLVINEKSQEVSLNHHYLEGIDLTLADMIVFPSVSHILTCLPAESALYLSNVIKWLKRMSDNTLVKKAAEKCGFQVNQLISKLESGIVNGEDKIHVPLVDKDSLYKRDSTHTKMKIKHRNPDDVLKILQEHSIFPTYCSEICTTLHWESLPPALNPATGDLPQKRIDRKCQQIESIVTAVLKVAFNGQTIVEFCAGGGHVGLLLAYILPNCKIIMIENKESSISRAKSRSEALNLKNIYFYQCNLDYFKGSFDLGVSLHACGVATDLVIQQCIKEQASFVCCPCCYGAIQNTHLLQYPLSKRFRSTTITYKMYTLLAHCADRTEVNTPTAEQGELCMGLIDTDRIFYGEENGYVVELTTLQPKTCSPKHNLLIGRSPKWRQQCEE